MTCPSCRVILERIAELMINALTEEYQTWSAAGPRCGICGQEWNFEIRRVRP